MVVFMRHERFAMENCHPSLLLVLLLLPSGKVLHFAIGDSTAHSIQHKNVCKHLCPITKMQEEEEEEAKVAHLRALAVVAEAREEEAAVVVGVVDKD